MDKNDEAVLKTKPVHKQKAIDKLKMAYIQLEFIAKEVEQTRRNIALAIWNVNRML